MKDPACNIYDESSQQLVAVTFAIKFTFGRVFDMFDRVFVWHGVKYASVVAKAYWESCSRSKIELFVKQPLTVFAKSAILDAWQGSEYASELILDYSLSFILLLYLWFWNRHLTEAISESK